MPFTCLSVTIPVSFKEQMKWLLQGDKLIQLQSHIPTIKVILAFNVMKCAPANLLEPVT